MKWIEIKAKFDSENKYVAADLVSNVFFDTDFKGVVVVDPDDEPVEGWGVGAEEKPDGDAVIGYLPKNGFSEKRIETFKNKLHDLKKRSGITCLVEFNEIDEKNWENSWKEYFWPEKIGSKIVVKPTWREYDRKDGEIVIELDPGMAFGTGSHPTTSLCVKLIEKYVKNKDSVLDIGTGSGILLIAAAMVGAGKLFGIDIDEVAVDIAKQNLLVNHIKPEIFQVKTGTLTATFNGATDSFDVVVGNILTDVIADLVEDVRDILKADGIFICSGIIEGKKDFILSKMTGAGFKILETHVKGDWVAIAGIKQ
jgi:ribosomal protein L11 methyltransferase